MIRKMSRFFQLIPEPGREYGADRTGSTRPSGQSREQAATRSGRDGRRLQAALVGLDEFRRIEALGFRPSDDLVIKRRVHGRRPGQDPEVFPARVADDRVGIVFGQVDDPVISPERPEELDPELGVAASLDNEGLALRAADLAVGTALPAGIKDPDISLVRHLIFGRRAVTALLEPLREGGDFEPFSHVPVKVDLVDGPDRLDSGVLGVEPRQPDGK